MKCLACGNELNFVISSTSCRQCGMSWWDREPGEEGMGRWGRGEHGNGVWDVAPMGCMRVEGEL